MRKLPEQLIDIKNSKKIIFYSPINKAEIYHGLRSGEESKTMDFFFPALLCL